MSQVHIYVIFLSLKRFYFALVFKCVDDVGRFLLVDMGLIKESRHPASFAVMYPGYQSLKRKKAAKHYADQTYGKRRFKTLANPNL